MKKKEGSEISTRNARHCFNHLQRNSLIILRVYGHYCIFDNSDSKTGLKPPPIGIFWAPWWGEVYSLSLPVIRGLAKAIPLLGKRPMPLGRDSQEVVDDGDHLYFK